MRKRTSRSPSPRPTGQRCSPGPGRGGPSGRCGRGERHPAQRCRSGIRDPGEESGGCSGIEARPKALATSQDVVIAQQYAENYPQIAAAAASSLSNIDNLVVINGAEGMEDMLAKAMPMGGACLGLAQQLMTSIKGDKTATVKLLQPSRTGRSTSWCDR